MSIEESLYIALQSIALSLGIILLGAIVGKWIFIRGAARAEFKDYIFRLVTGANQAATVLAKIKSWAIVATTDGVLGLIGVPQEETNAVAGKGLQMVLTGAEGSEIQSALETDVLAARETINKSVKRVILVAATTLFFVMLSTGVGLAICLSFKNIESLGLLGLYTMAMSVCYGLLFVLPISILFVRGLKQIATQLQLECELVVSGLSMIAEGETAESVTTKLTAIIDSS